MGASKKGQRSFKIFWKSAEEKLKGQEETHVKRVAQAGKRKIREFIANIHYCFLHPQLLTKPHSNIKSLKLLSP